MSAAGPPQSANSPRPGGRAPAQPQAGGDPTPDRRVLAAPAPGPAGGVGPAGRQRLCPRGRAQARADHPALGQIQLHARSEPYIEGVAETIMAKGDPATAEALESMLVRLVELLGRLIGDDMAMKLIERSLAASERGDATPNSKREEA